jgi:hypothetical protein
MPVLKVTLTWQEWESLETIAKAEEISIEEVVRRALDVYLAQEHVQRMRPKDESVTATRDHLVGPGEVMDLDL